MKEVKLNSDNYVQVLQLALEVMRRGGVVIYPTETAYGLGGDFYSKKAVNKIYRIKSRAKKKFLPVIVADIVTASSLVKFTSRARDLASLYWPGPLTLVLPFSNKSWQKSFGDPYLALRVSNHPFASSLAVQLGNPLISTSANLSGQGNCYSATEIKKQFKNAKVVPDLFINAGRLKKTKPSTIIKCDTNGNKILRQGDIKVTI